MALIGEMKYLQIGTSVYEIPTSELPIASSSTLGGIKVGTNLSIDSSTGVLSASFTETDPTVPSWAKASTKPTYTASEVGAVATSAVGAASGVAPLNASSKIDSTYLPSYVDDVIEGYYYNDKFWKEAAHTTEITGEAGKIYVDLSTNKTYRYSGSAFVEVSSGSLVTITRNLTSGTKSATINIDGTDYDIYSVTNTDTKVTQTILNGGGGYQGLLFSKGTGASTTTDTIYTSSLLQWNEYVSVPKLTLYNAASQTRYLTLKYDSITIGNSSNTNQGVIQTAALTGSRTYTLPDATGTIALTSDIPSAYTSTPSAPGTGSAGSSTSYSKGDHVHPKELPTVSSSDNGKVLTVVSGAWAAASLPLYQGGVS